MIERGQWWTVIDAKFLVSPFGTDQVFFLGIKRSKLNWIERKLAVTENKCLKQNGFERSTGRIKRWCSG